MIIDWNINYIPEYNIGMWGVKLDQRRDLVQGLTRTMILAGRNQDKGTDQSLLEKILWPSAQYDVVSWLTISFYVIITAWYILIVLIRWLMTVKTVNSRNSKTNLQFKCSRSPHRETAIISWEVSVRNWVRQNVQKHVDHQNTRIGNTVNKYLLNQLNFKKINHLVNEFQRTDNKLVDSADSDSDFNILLWLTLPVGLEESDCSKCLLVFL